MRASNAAIFAGCAPAIMTPCDNQGVPDFEELVRVAKHLIDQGMRAVVWAGSMGDWPNLSDEQRKLGVKHLVDAGVPLIVGVGHVRPAMCVELARHASQVGAQGLMVIPRQGSRVSVEAAQEAHFNGVLKAANGLPSVIYNSRYYGFEVKAGLFRRLREANSNLVGFKEFCGKDALSYAAQHITSGDDDLVLTVGVDTAVTHGYLHCGAVGAITGVGNALPEQVLFLIRLCEHATSGQGDTSLARRLALELEEALGELSRYDEGPDLVMYYKYLMTLVGYEKFGYSIVPSDMLSTTQRAHLRSQYELFCSWWDSWSGREFGFPTK